MTKRRGQTIHWQKEEDRQYNDKKKKDKNTNNDPVVSLRYWIEGF
jgi:hypothetical protein